MADDITTSAPATAASTSAPAEAAVSPTPVVENSSAAESTVQAPLASTEAEAPIVDPVKTETPAEAPKVETLLAGEKKTEEKPVEAKTESETEEKPVEVKADEVPPVPTYEAFKLPDGVTFDDAKLGDFSKSLAEFEINTKAPHEEVQKLGQQLIDRHVSELKNTMDRYTKSLSEAWSKQKNDWKDSFLKDPEFANRTDTVVNSAIDAIGVFGGDSRQQEEFRNLMESSGVGNHPAMIRLLSNVMLAKSEGKPLAAPQIAMAVKSSRIEKMYGKKTGG